MTKVIFKKTKDNEIIAFFPDTLKEGVLTSYMHIGQHSDAVIDFYSSCKKASENEYTELLNELINSVGYDDLKISHKLIYNR